MRSLCYVLVSVSLLAGCASASFVSETTPAGGYCSDMPVLADDNSAGAKYHRIKAIQSDRAAKTMIEKIESLRRIACSEKADAVVDVLRDDLPGGKGYILIGFAARINR